MKNIQDSLKTVIKKEISSHNRGWCFTPQHFITFGSSDAVRKALSRLENEGIIRRLTHGLYEYPKTHKKLGVLPPSIEAIIEAVNEKYHIKTQPTGAYAANLLGLSEQVPAKITFLTDGQSKVLYIDNLEIRLKKTTTKNMKMAGKISGLIVQALKFIGEKHIDSKIISKLKKKLSKTDIKQIELDRNLAPIWITKVIDKIIEGKDK